MNHKIKNRFFFILGIAVLVFVAACNQSATKSEDKTSGKLRVVTTTTMITDLLNQLGGDKIIVQGLMGSGVDPHLYKATESDVTKLYEADIIIYNGLHLEGKLVDILEKMQSSSQKTYAIGDAIPEQKLIKANAEYAQHDPHIWFDINNWKLAAQYVAQILSENDTANGNFYKERLSTYLNELAQMQNEVKQSIAKLEPEKRVLITAHDAFEYFGRAYNFEVVGLQGISTVSEAGAADVRKMADFIFERKIPAVFVESSVPVRNIQALRDAVQARGMDVKIGGELFSDALGSAATPEGTYVGMYRYNVATIVGALKNTNE